ncbi:MAG: M3 family oligoendopeptidase [Bacteroidales bacterium]|jgi:oligoendopeptidase F|nr:M3 family oligoendopeptidase [Bacteroidales bacterium]
MNHFLQQAKQRRTWIAPQFEVTSWEVVEPYFVQLIQFPITSLSNLQQFLAMRSELDAVLEEDMAWRYIRMSCNTADAQATLDFEFFVNSIQSHIYMYDNELDRKFLQSPFVAQLPEKYSIMRREIQNRVELFCKKNIPLFTELEQQEQEYGAIASQMTVEIDGEQKTLHQAQVFLKSTDREKRETVYRAIVTRRMADEQQLNDLLTQLIAKRHEIALNAGFTNFRDYKFRALNRFDYSKEDCFAFHSAIQKIVPPLVEKLYKSRKEKLGVERLQPFDLEVNIEGENIKKPFTDAQDLLQKSIRCFNDIKPEYGDFLQQMGKYKYLDLDSRIGKAPGGFNYPLYESNVPFIFMNAAGTQRDVETLMHEGGHALHSHFSAHLPLVEFKSLPAEVAELASMSMELIAMEHWHTFFNNAIDLQQAKRSVLEGILTTISWIAMIDKFQHRLYENPQHSIEERTKMWQTIQTEFAVKNLDYTGFERYRDCGWQKQLHIFEVPLYYIEYGFAQLGALALWKNYKQNPENTLRAYEEFLRQGNTKPIPELYSIAGISFEFSYEYVNEIMSFLMEEIQKVT